MLSIIAIVLVLGALIFFHELGHFLVAKSFRMGVKTFSLGFGPKLAGFHLGKTNYVLSAFPLGGYVQLVGETPEAEIPEDFDQSENFSLRPPWQRMLVVSAGPFFNFLLAWAIYVLIFLFIGSQAMLPVVGEVKEDSPAQKANLKAGDKILSIENQEIEYWQDMAEQIKSGSGQELHFRIERDNQILEMEIRPEVQTTKNIFGETIKVPRIGIVASKEVVNVPMGPLESLWGAVVQTWNLIALTVEALVKIIERIVPLKTIGGPIMIAQLVSQQAHQGLVDVLALTALISINLGLINLLPIPVLDGGHILFYSLETILRRPLDPKWRELAMKIGISLLIALMALAVYNDIYRILHTK